jgi:hypothetical protein
MILHGVRINTWVTFIHWSLTPLISTATAKYLIEDDDDDDEAGHEEDTS